MSDEVTTLIPKLKVFTPSKYEADPKFNATDYDLLSDSFGLIGSEIESSKRWLRFHKAITKLNDDADEGTAYKVVYLARHGQGYHNLAENKYGTKAWDDYWAMLYGDGEITWGPDPFLTALGVSQAKAANRGWKQQIEDNIPSPERMYSSPLTRSAKTLEITWHDILLNKGVKPLIKERLRETIGLHTCDLRSTKTVIHERFPGYDIEPGFTEEDELWTADRQETEEEEAKRLNQQLNEIFATDPSTFISITAHGGVIQAFFHVVHHRIISIPPGGFLPIVVKGTK